MEKKSKLAVLKEHLRAGRNHEAIKLAASFPRLPDEHRAAILEGREAIARPEFQRSLKRDPEVQIATAIAALKAAFGDEKP